MVYITDFFALIYGVGTSVFLFAAIAQAQLIVAELQLVLEVSQGVQNLVSFMQCSVFI